MLAIGLAGCVLLLSPRRIVVGGGIVESRADVLLPMVRRELASVGGYDTRESGHLVTELNPGKVGRD